MTKDRIVFFANGDFAIETFETLVENGFNIVGLVTSTNDKVKYHAHTIRQSAERLSVPYYLAKGGNIDDDEFLMDWLKRADADIFCVISFKKLPESVTRLARKCAFNVHASLLPFLRGAAPINWAIRLGYKETGLTAFVLSDKIDQGDIIANTKVKISEGEKFTSLYRKLSYECIDFTGHVIGDVLQSPDWKSRLISQPSWNAENEYVQYAPKVDAKYFECYWKCFSPKKLKNLVDSVDDSGLPCSITVQENGVKEFKAKIYEVEVVKPDDGGEDVIHPFINSDGKTYIRMFASCITDPGYVLIKRIQLAGKKVMDVKDFLNGFRYFRDSESVVITYDKDYV